MSLEDKLPTVLIAILVKNKEYCLKEYLKCITSLEYPKDRIHIYIRENDSKDASKKLLKSWIRKNKDRYGSIKSNFESVDPDHVHGEHEWSVRRFKVLGAVRQKSFDLAVELKTDYYFVVDVDNFILPETLNTMVKLNLDFVSPLLVRFKDHFYANYHNVADPNGYFQANDAYKLIRFQKVRGILEVDVAHTTYLIRTSVIPKLTYDDNTNRYEYVILSHSARKNGVIQHLDNRKIYGYIIFETSEMNQVQEFMEEYVED